MGPFESNQTITLSKYEYRRRISSQNASVISLPIRLLGSELASRSLRSVGYLFLSLTGGTPHYVRQTPPVGRSEKARRHSTELQWSLNTNTSDLRYH